MMATKGDKIKRAAAARGLIAAFAVKGAKGTPAKGTLPYQAGDQVRLSEKVFPTLQAIDIEGTSYPLTFRVHRLSPDGWIHIETEPVKVKSGAHFQPRLSGRIHVPVKAAELVAIAQPRQAAQTDPS